MLNSEKIIKALNNIPDEFIEETADVLTAKNASLKHKSFWKVALIAAVIAALLAVVGYAAGWYGISSRVTQSQNTDSTTRTGYMSLNGYAGSPEALASIEWKEYYDDYMEQRNWNEDAEDYLWCDSEEEKGTAKIYNAINREMMDKLCEIRDKYNIHLHTDMALPQNMEQVYSTCGIEPFMRIDEEAYVIFPMYIFEDGSVQFEGITQNSELDCSFSMNRGRTGTLFPYTWQTDLNPEEYDEWQYESDSGSLINIALRKNASEFGLNQMFVFAQEGDYLITIISNLEEKIASKENAEKLADFFNYGALKGKTVDLSSIINTKPNEAEPDDELMTLKEFAETPEYLASVDFYAAYNNYIDSNIETLEPDEDMRRPSGEMEYKYYGSLPGHMKEVNELYEEVITQYPLIETGECEMVWRGNIMPAEVISFRGDIDIKKAGITLGKSYSDKYPPVEDSEYFEMLGLENFIGGEHPDRLLKYSNGGFMLRFSLGRGNCLIHYIPKGCFYPLLKPFLTTDETSWAYEAACGEQVSLSMGGGKEGNFSGQQTALYETENAYVLAVLEEGREAYELEMMADTIDFSKFK